MWYVNYFECETHKWFSNNSKMSQEFRVNIVFQIENYDSESIKNNSLKSKKVIKIFKRKTKLK